MHLLPSLLITVQYRALVRSVSRYSALLSTFSDSVGSTFPFSQCGKTVMAGMCILVVQRRNTVYLRHNEHLLIAESQSMIYFAI
ncbi:hypothetical protein B0H14DRAFT_748987 [Mycena olivaceomarginata]|nr:hypothetical protein B0H14DRAFT_748987 [Mycena olivaceomarginata]